MPQDDFLTDVYVRRAKAEVSIYPKIIVVLPVAELMTLKMSLLNACKTI
jgi:hypothetical protein